MKRMFGWTKKPAQEWDGCEEEYDWDLDAQEEGYGDPEEEDGGAELFQADDGYDPEEEDVFDAESLEETGYDPQDELYYSEDEEDGTGYGEDMAYDREDGTDFDGDGAYYREDGTDYSEDEAYDGEDGAFYADEEDGADPGEELYAEELEDTAGLEQMAEEDGYEYYTFEGNSDVDEDGGRSERRSQGRGKKPSLWVKLQKGLAGMTAMDRVILGTGVGVLILALVVGSVFAGTRASEEKSVSLAAVGAQLDGIETIGETGLLAVADAQLAKLAAANAVNEEEQAAYDEEAYQKEVTVAMEMVSVQRDLKIKFINQKTDRLISNVPFAVNVTDPDGGSAVWSDDDMDGIIYKTEIKPGNYKVVMEPLADERYAGYVLNTTSAEKVEVRKNIAYQAVNVSNEVKSEKEVNAKAEDTKVNETQVESVLQDTVEWVESRVVASAYNEVPKSSIPDPMTLALSKTFERASEVSPGDASTEPSTDPSSEPTEAPSASPTASPEATESPAPTDTPTPTQTPVYPDAKLTVTPGALSLTVNGTATATATAPGVPEAVKSSVKYEISTAPKSEIATASVESSSGVITVKGVGAGETSVGIKVTYTAENTTQVTSTEATLKITVAAARTITLDKTAATVYLGEPVTIKATVSGVADPAVTVVSSDANVATVKADKGVITITGVKAGTATITVGYSENNVASPNVTCAVTVKDNPKNNKTAKLKDASGHQVYVNENGAYREAVYADYYTAAKFYLMGEAKYTGWQTLDGKVYYFRADGSKVTGEQVIQGAKYNFASDGSLVVGDGRMGIDVSKWNGSIDWNAVKNSGVNYVIIRSGYRGSSAGSLIEDPKFVTNIKGATAAGLKVGIYFFTQAVNEVEAVEEASMVLNQVRNYTISYPIFLDVEASGGRADAIDKATRTAVCKAFCQTIQNGGYTAGIYANKTWLNSKIDAGALGAYKIWLAQYASTPTYTGRYDMWQYRSTGRVSGISGDVDMNLSYLGY